MGESNPQVAVVMGSHSDLDVMRPCMEELSQLGVRFEVRILSAHRTPAAVSEFAAAAGGRGVKVVIAAAGMSAALGGALSGQTALPVIGVAVASGPLGGVDALLSTVQMPPGVPVGCVGIGRAGAVNAAVYAAEILALNDADLADRLKHHRAARAEKTLAKDREIRRQFPAS